MSLEIEQNQPLEANAETGLTGLVGTIKVAVVDNDGATVIAATTLNITENSVGGMPTGNYTWNAPAAPASVGQYQILWSTDGTFAPASVISEDLLVIPFGTSLLPPPVADGVQIGPCTAWIDEGDVANCCGVVVGSDTFLFAASAVSASELLYALSGRQFSGVCQRTVRPCLSRSCGFQVLSKGHIVDWGGVWALDHWEPSVCDCQPVSRVELANHPVTDILEVKIDGVALTASEYELRRHQYLVRKRDVNGDRQFWPSCQIEDLDDTEPGTFSVRYLHGINPPQAGIDAAAQLACEIYKSCPNAEGVGNCALPKNATKVTRQGIMIELGVLRFDRKKGWDTGMKLVDAFLNTYNPYGKQRRPAIWSPDERLPEPVATVGT